MSEDQNKINILVVDDSDMILLALKNFFKDYNFGVITCHDGLEGIQKALEIKPSLIILDLLMPNLDGVKMLRVIKVMDNIKDIPVIVISGNTNKRNVIAAIEAGAEKVLSKPLKKEILKKSISEVLGPDFFQKTKPKTVVSHENDDKAFQEELREFFTKSFHIKKDLMESSLENKDIRGLRHAFHELKGSGASIGYQILTDIGDEVETKIDEKYNNWEYYRSKCNEVYNIVDSMNKKEKTTE